MNVVGKVGSLISQGVYSVATPFHPFGGAVDIIAVQQQDGSFRSTPWYVRFGKFQGVLKGAEKMVKITVNGVEANFHMYLDNSGEAYFIREVESGESGTTVGILKEPDTFGEDIDKDGIISENISIEKLESSVSDNGDIQLQDENNSLETESDGSRCFYEFPDDNNVDGVENYLDTQSSSSEVVLVSVDGHILTAPISNSELTGDDVELDTPQFHLGPGKRAEFCEDNAEFSNDKDTWNVEYLAEDSKEVREVDQDSKEVCEVDQDSKEFCEVDQENDVHDAEPRGEIDETKKDVFQSCLELPKLDLSDEIVPPLEIEDKKDSSLQAVEDEMGSVDQPLSSLTDEEPEKNETKESPLASSSEGIEISLCGNLLQAGMGLTSAEEVFKNHLISEDEFRLSSATLVKNENLVIKFKNRYLTWEKAAPIVLGIVAYDVKLPLDPKDAIQVDSVDTPKSTAVDGSELTPTTPSRRWRLWPIPFRRVKTLEHTPSSSSSDDVFVDTESVQSQSPERALVSNGGGSVSSHKQLVRTNVPTTEQITSLNLKDGQNMISFSFSTRVFGLQQVDAHMYLWKWNARIVISDVDGTITKSDVLGQVMPLVGKDWSQSGVARLFSAIKENGYQLLFLSARAIVQAYLTRSFLLNLKQDGNALPSGPVVISPDGLFPSLYREVIRRAPHEFKIACLEDIKALFPPDYNPFYAGFGNRDTDELSYRKIGIPKGKIFIINPKGEVAISQHRIDVKTYTSLHTLVNDMFPPTMVEQEDFNSWNFWKMPMPEIDC
ncbi:phosphatidate phosphatase PAH1-like [Impatiens glandulifera]|uniref:phosphatidate phosphatase PAH1-like n=1 Tax=Impatiens glandulifera TaxID=253017 RepID=UPI001FB0F5B3|nr:phosphatidate phosphatase PAH1-like [Impatiens glandulifera]